MVGVLAILVFRTSEIWHNMHRRLGRCVQLRHGATRTGTFVVSLLVHVYIGVHAERGTRPRPANMAVASLRLQAAGPGRRLVSRSTSLNVAPVTNQRSATLEKLCKITEIVSIERRGVLCVRIEDKETPSRSVLDERRESGVCRNPCSI